MALCSESTGTIWPGWARAWTSGPPMIRDSLLARARMRPASRAARVAARPTAPVTALRTMSQPEAGGLGGDGLLEGRQGCLGGDGDDFCSELERLGGEEVGVAAAGGQAGDAEPPRGA